MALIVSALWLLFTSAAALASPEISLQNHPLPSGPADQLSARMAQGSSGAVSSEDSRCSELGRVIMEELGGNAVDATIGVTSCLGVVNPMASGIGGGGFLLFLPANATTPLTFDFREVAPGKASEDMYAADEELKSYGPLSVGVPGEVAGMYMLWQEYGTLPWSDLLEPAILLASNGFIVKPFLASSIQSQSSYILADEGLREVFAPNGSLLVAGDLCVQSALAKSLACIGAEGSAAFYNGSVGAAFVKDVSDAGGILTMDDLTRYTVKLRDPTTVDILGLTIFGMPPPSSGGACVALALNILAAYPDPFQAVEGPLGLHRMVEAIKHAFALRMNLSDPEFVDVTDAVNMMLNATYAAQLQRLINDNTTYPPSYYGGSWSQLDDHGTSHFNIVDRDRNVVSVTTTINYSFGAKILSRSTGIIMNNEMGDFSIQTNNTGSAPPAPANFIQPYKRPLSSMAPTIVTKNGQFVGALGGSGGTKIITATLQVFLNAFWKGYSPLSAVSSPRLHHELFPDKLYYENWTTVEGEHLQVAVAAVDYLASKGHIITSDTGGMTELVMQDLGEEQLNLGAVGKGRGMRLAEEGAGLLTAVSDLRKDGCPSAF